jgi:hypothetical protein
MLFSMLSCYFYKPRFICFEPTIVTSNNVFARSDILSTLLQPTLSNVLGVFGLEAIVILG